MFQFFLALTLCVLSSFVWLYLAWRQHSGGSYRWKINEFGQETREKIFDGKKIPFFSTSAFKMFIVHFIAGSIVFALIAADFWDTWFE